MAISVPNTNRSCTFNRGYHRQRAQLRNLFEGSAKGLRSLTALALVPSRMLPETMKLQVQHGSTVQIIETIGLNWLYPLTIFIFQWNFRILFVHYFNYFLQTTCPCHESVPNLVPKSPGFQMLQSFSDGVLCRRPASPTSNTCFLLLLVLWDSKFCAGWVKAP